MAREVFVERTFRRSTMVTQAHVIVAEYGAQGFALTLRPLYYQFVARGHLTAGLSVVVLYLGDHDCLRPKTLRAQLRSVADLVDYLGARLARLEPST
jgi:hypothetical protein